MLTIEALRSKKWRLFPVLRKVLESKQSHRYDTLLSTDDTIFAAFERLLDISALVQEHKGELRAAIAEERKRGDRHDNFADGTMRDIEHLKAELEALRQYLASEIRSLEGVQREIYS